MKILNFPEGRELPSEVEEELKQKEIKLASFVGTSMDGMKGLVLCTACKKNENLLISYFVFNSENLNSFMVRNAGIVHNEAQAIELMNSVKGASQTSQLQSAEMKIYNKYATKR